MLTKGKHNFGEINETRVTFVEKGVSDDRAQFLKKLLEHNGYEVLIGEGKKPKVKEGEPEPPGTFDVGVTDMVFNPVVAVYQRILKTFEGNRITPDYWNQKTSEAEPNYWDWDKKEWWKKEQEEKRKAAEEAKRIAEEKEREAQALAQKNAEEEAAAEKLGVTDPPAPEESPETPPEEKSGLKGSLLGKSKEKSGLKGVEKPAEEKPAEESAESKSEDKPLSEKEAYDKKEALEDEISEDIPFEEIVVEENAPEVEGGTSVEIDTTAEDDNSIDIQID